MRLVSTALWPSACLRVLKFLAGARRVMAIQNLRRVLIAGGAGFIGSNLAHRLHAAGVEVEVADNLLSGSKGNLPPGVPFARIDCAKQAYVDRFSAQDWDAVFHFAGASSAPMFDERPERAAQAIAAFQNSLEVARSSGARVAFASTSSFYARCPKPFREDMQVTPGTLYEFSKLAMEHLALAYHRRYGVPSVALRFFSVYGPREEAKGRFANVLSQFMWCLRAGVSPVIYGDGAQTRDFTHVDDLLEGILVALDRADGFDAYNIGTGVEHDFNEVVALLRASLGTKTEPVFVENPVANYVAETLADNSKLRALGWRPRVRVEDGIRRLVEEAPPLELPRVLALVR